MKRVLALSVPLTVLLAGCGLRDPSIELTAFDSCEALENSVKDQALEEVRWAYSWGGGFGGVRSTEMTLDSGMDAAPEVAGSASGDSRTTSDTNVQVEGVDEADLMETDGTYIYSLAGDHLVITKAWPAVDAELVSMVALEGIPQGIYLKDDGTLVVLSQLSYDGPRPISGGESTRVESQAIKTTIIDLSDVNEPLVEREVYTAGSLKTSRLIGDRLYVVSYSPMDHSPIWAAQEKHEALRAVRVSTLADWIPGRFDNIKTGEAWASSEVDVSDCANIYGSDRLSGNYLVNIESLDTAEPEAVFHGTSVLGSVDAVYANHRSLYVVSQEADDGPWQSYDRTIETVIHRFDIEGGPEAPEYVSSGVVPGWVLNQFSMDEHDGIFRIATTYNGGGGWNNTASGVYTLEEDGDELKVIGETDGMGQGEEIFSVRFQGDTGYVVTFERVDPLYTLDLSDPTNIVQRGELEITGFSNYMHPIGEGKLLAIGMEATEWGELQNVQISLFDVTDLDAPTLQSRLQLPGTVWSEAQNDHHAFNYFAEREVLLLPAATDYDSSSELYIISASPDAELETVGVVDQEDLTAQVPSDYDEWSWRYCTEFRRSVVIEDVAYAISNAGITSVDLDEPDQVYSSVPFTGVDVCAGSYYWW